MSVRRVLVIGSGGREHALAWRLARDPGSPEVFVAPGNEGIAQSFRCLPIPSDDLDGLRKAVRHESIDLAVIGPEAPLASGVADGLESAGVPVFGPRAAAARLESSKSFAKQVMEHAKIPTARAESHDNLPAALGALSRFSPPYVIKADGLASGKGVCVTPEASVAEQFLDACLRAGRFGAGGARVLIEEFLEGEEASVMAVCDGERFVLLPSARDYKRAEDGDRGPNTGGMGALAPTPGVSRALEAEVGERIVSPLLRYMASCDSVFRGVLYCGLMLGAEGPRVVEFNVRFGDPEAEAVLPLVDGDLSALLASAAGGELQSSRIERAAGATVVVALVHHEYPGTPVTQAVIEGLDSVVENDGVTVFHAGVRRVGAAWRTTGGRAAYVMARAEDFAAARTRVYSAIDQLRGSGWRCRHDIGAGVGISRAPAPAETRIDEGI